MSNRKVLLAVDASTHAEQALQWMAAHVYREGDTVLLVHVLEPTMLYPSYAAIQPMEVGVVDLMGEVAKAQERAGGQLVKQFAEQLRAKHIPHREFLLKGFAKEEIANLAAEEKVDMVVCGTRGMGLVKRVLLGSVSDYLIHHCRCPVIVVRPPAAE